MRVLASELKLGCPTMSVGPIVEAGSEEALNVSLSVAQVCVCVVCVSADATRVLWYRSTTLPPLLLCVVSHDGDGDDFHRRRRGDDDARS